MTNDASGRIFVGIGGWTFEPWEGTFYPDNLPAKRQLEYASSKLTSIEVNGTYYSTQKPDTFAKWAAETPEDFVFCLKASRYSTNRKELATAGESIDRFVSSGIARLGKKLGPVNWQLATTKKFDAADIAAFLKLLPKEADGLPLRHVIEARHESFRCAEFLDLIRAQGVATVLSVDDEYPQIPDPTADFVYARIMGTVESEPLGYSPAALDLWATRAKDWAAGRVPDGLDYVGKPEAGKPRDVFLYVISGHKERNPLAAMALIARLDG